MFYSYFIANSWAEMVTKGFSYYFEKVKCSSHNSYFLHQSCTETCTVVCGFWYLYRRICSNVISPPVFSFSLPYICYAGGLVNVYNNNSSALKIDCNKSCCLKNCFTNDCFWTRSNSITARCIVAKFDRRTKIRSSYVLLFICHQLHANLNNKSHLSWKPEKIGESRALLGRCEFRGHIDHKFFSWRIWVCLSSILWHCVHIIPFLIEVIVPVIGWNYILLPIKNLPPAHVTSSKWRALLPTIPFSSSSQKTLPHYLADPSGTEIKVSLCSCGKGNYIWFHIVIDAKVLIR